MFIFSVSCFFNNKKAHFASPYTWGWHSPAWENRWPRNSEEKRFLERLRGLSHFSCLCSGSVGLLSCVGLGLHATSAPGSAPKRRPPAASRIRGPSLVLSGSPDAPAFLLKSCAAGLPRFQMSAPIVPLLFPLSLSLGLGGRIPPSFHLLVLKSGSLYYYFKGRQSNALHSGFSSVLQAVLNLKHETSFPR